jgi:hypothetical protein
VEIQQYSILTLKLDGCKAVSFIFGAKILITPEKSRWAVIVDSDTSEKRNTLFQPEI